MKLIFVYNANHDFMSSVTDTARKIVSPDTYECNLCKITYPLISMDGDWKKFIESIPHEVSFLHRDEFYKQYPEYKDIRLPAVFVNDDSETKLLIGSDEINKVKNVIELIKTVERFLQRQTI